MANNNNKENTDNQYRPRTPEYRGHYDPDNEEPSSAHNRPTTECVHFEMAIHGDESIPESDRTLFAYVQEGQLILKKRQKKKKQKSEETKSEASTSAASTVEKKGKEEEVADTDSDVEFVALEKAPKKKVEVSILGAVDDDDDDATLPSTASSMNSCTGNGLPNMRRSRLYQRRAAGRLQRSKVQRKLTFDKEEKKKKEDDGNDHLKQQNKEEEEEQQQQQQQQQREQEKKEKEKKVVLEEKQQQEKKKKKKKKSSTGVAGGTEGKKKISGGAGDVDNDNGDDDIEVLQEIVSVPDEQKKKKKNKKGDGDDEAAAEKRQETSHQPERAFYEEDDDDEVTLSGTSTPHRIDYEFIELPHVRTVKQKLRDVIFDWSNYERFIAFRVLKEELANRDVSMCDFLHKPQFHVNAPATYPWAWEDEVARKVLLKALRPAQTEWRAEKSIRHKIRRFFRQEERAKNNYFTQLEIENLRLLRGSEKAEEKAKERQEQLNALRALCRQKEENLPHDDVDETTDGSKEDGEEYDHIPLTTRTHSRRTVHRVKRKERVENEDAAEHEVIESGTGDEDTNSERENISSEKGRESIDENDTLEEAEEVEELMQQEAVEEEERGEEEEEEEML